MLHGRLAMLGVVVVALALAAPAMAETYTWIGGTDSNWSTAANWSGTTPSTYPDDKNDEAVFTAAATVDYDVGATGVLGTLRNPNDGQSVIINLKKNLLLDYTGSAGANPTPGSWYTRGKDAGTRPQIKLDTGLTLTLNGLYHNGGSNTRFACFSGTGKRQGTVVFQPDASGKCYYGGTGSNPFYLIYDYGGYPDAIDFTQAAEIVVSSHTGSGTIGTGPIAQENDENNSANSPEVRVGRDLGQDQVWSSTGTGMGTQMTLRAQGMSGYYGPKLVVTASGTDADPNLVSFKAGGISGLNLPTNTTSYNQRGGSWIVASGAGVARLVLEGNFTVGDQWIVDSLWDTSQIQVHMAGETPASQVLRWCGEDKNDHTPGSEDYATNFTGLDDNYAVRKLIIGSDEGTATNHVDFDTSPLGSALYCYGLEFTTGGYLNILNPDDYIYYLGTKEEVNGIPGMGLVVPGNLADFTNRPENIIMLGENLSVIPEPAGLGLIGLALMSLRKRRTRHG